MIVLHNIKEGPTSNYDSREKVKAYLDAHPTEMVSFDGVYESVYENRDLFVGRKCILFVTGNYIGKDNSFDEGQPLEKFCNWEQILEMEHMGMEIGWHTWSHPDLTKMDENWRIDAECTPPFRMRHFAWPYGKMRRHAHFLQEDCGFTFGWGIQNGDLSSQFWLPRHHI